MTKIKTKRDRVKFASDNVAGACPEVLDAIIKANEGDSTPYGNDQISTELQDKFSEIFEKEVIVFPTASGTAANALALATMTPSFGNVYCHKLSHINTDECGAPEFYTGGGKLVTLNGVKGKITAEELDQAISGKGIVHHTQPSSVSITQVCETGEVYQLDEIKKISEVTHKHNLSIHMDGARFANALVSLNATPAEMTWKSGIDVLSFGATKNGCIAAEAIIFFKKDLVGNVAFLMKRAGHLLSKMRFVSAQLDAYISNDVWLRNAKQANKMGKKLSDGLKDHSDINLAYPTEANEVFATFPRNKIDHLNSEGYQINEDEWDGKAVRLVAAWNTQDTDVDHLLNSLKNSN
ncbi:low specificity L-threonine aldolase [Pelagibacterales bacterium SAG-MED06]|nr:low specificity L-threonine aldolase [Pelagibacterales bacterium SAG-MED06]|tara:strand:+ start:104 stop:1156 length:1053 start_codon:yes stop_codon:yes gene_type:complete